MASALKADERDERSVGSNPTASANILRVYDVQITLVAY